MEDVCIFEHFKVQKITWVAKKSLWQDPKGKEYFEIEKND